MIKSRLLPKSSKLPNPNGSQFTLNELKQKCKELGITNSVIYRNRYKEIPGFPAHPERIYIHDWVSYKDFFDIKDFLSYQEVVELILPRKLKNANEYKKFVKNEKDPTIPLDPQTVYETEWMNWYRFLGKEEPFKTNFIPAKYTAWAEKINEFMKQARGGGTKVSQLCRFVRFFIEAYDKSLSPETFLTQKTFNIKPFRKVLDGFETKKFLS
jgi:hypothetical protein